MKNIFERRNRIETYEPPEEEEELDVPPLPPPAPVPDELPELVPPRPPVKAEIDDVMDQQVLRKMIWTNTNILTLVMFFSMVSAAMSAFVDWRAKIISFLVVSLFTALFWGTYKRKVKELL